MTIVHLDMVEKIKRTVYAIDPAALWWWMMYIM
jgi:hypothetical protein